VDGANRFSVFSRVTVPLTFPALAAGAVMAWARALGEFRGTIIFAGSFPVDDAVALSVMVLGFAFTVILAARRGFCWGRWRSTRPLKPRPRP
jgi:molybdate transport system permease protein